MRLPVILQTEGAECGIACIAMIANHFGHRVDLASMRRRFSFSMRGTTLAQMLKVAAALRLTARPMRAEPRQLRALGAPLLLHWNLNHFVVLKWTNGSTFIIHDPAVGVRKLTEKQFSAHFTGIAVAFAPQPDFSPEKDSTRYTFRQLTGRIGGLSSALFTIFGLALALEVFVLIMPFMLQFIVDSVIATGDMEFLGTIAIAFSCLLLVQVSIGFARTWSVLAISAEVNQKWQANVFTHLLRLPMTYFERRYAGDVSSRFNATSTIQRAVTHDFVEALLDGIFVLTAAALMIIYSLKLSIIAAASSMLYALSRWAYFGHMNRASSEHIIHVARQESHFWESIKGIQAIKTFCAQDERRMRWAGMLTETTRSDFQLKLMHAITKSTSNLTLGLERIAIIWLGATMVVSSELTLGMLLAFLSLRELFSSRAYSLIDKLSQFRLLRLEADRLSDIVLSEPEPSPAWKGQAEHAALRTVPSIEFRAVSFRYSEDDPWLLENVSFKLESRQSMVVTGPSGGGKSTFIKILLGLLQPTSGTVLINGIDLATIGPECFRETVGCVMQDDQLFAGSISENISFFDPSPDHELIEASAKQAAIHRVVASMPMGYETLVGDMGAALSGGQRQRLFLARALYRKPKVLVLDEATSHLDVQNEALVGESLAALNMTMVLVAHRRETIRTAKRVFQLGAGHLTEVGHSAGDLQPA